MESASRFGIFPVPKISHSRLRKVCKLLPSYGYGDQSNGVVSICCTASSNRVQGISCENGSLQKHRSSVDSSLFRYDTPIPEEIIEKPVGLSLPEKNVGKNSRCLSCEAKGAVLCSTCSGSGLYIDSIMESQGIIVKVRCLGCGGTGNIMCSGCGGRGHI